MTDDYALKRLSGWIRLVPDDGFGIPLFVSEDANIEFIPETDNALRIVAFHQFDNAEGYNLDRSLPPSTSRRRYAVGDGAPIPFVSQGVFNVADGAASASAFLSLHRDRAGDPIIQEIANILVKAETGEFERKKLDRGGKEFEDRHAAVFSQGPVHSRYWVEQYDHAAKELAAIRSVTTSLIWEKLKLIGSEWLKRFSTSGDPQILVRFLDAAERNTLLDRDEVKDIYYVVMASLISKEDFKSLLQTDVKKQAERRIPEGLYYYELSKRGLRQPNGDLVFASTVNLLSEMKWILRDGEKRCDFKVALQISNLLFGRNQLPPEIHDVAGVIASDLVYRIETDTKSYHGQAPRVLKNMVISRYLALEGLRRVMDWQERSATTSVAMGLSNEADWISKEWVSQRSRRSEE